MKKQTQILIAAIMSLFAMGASAQTPTGADYMVAFKKANANVAFDVNSEGEPFYVKWGMDTSWNWDYNVNRGVAHFGKGNFELGRISFQPNAKVIENADGSYSLTTAQKNALASRCRNIKLSGCTNVEINCDQEDATSDKNIATYKEVYLGHPQEWYKLIKASVQYANTQGVKVVSISPFNEPDYSAWGQGSAADMKELCRLIREDPYFDDVHICAGNTLNCDQALTWYNNCKPYVDEGNTHQLAGTFDSYAKFFTQVKAEGKICTADELHNVGEAIAGVNYGMENGIWWAFDARARGQFMKDSNQGVRIGYGESRNTWTMAAVYRNEKEHEVHGFFGSSERQANKSSFAYVSTTKDVFFNGYGPTRMYVYDVPGGTGYQQGQINAERVFDITWGEDVAPGVINGTYQIMNASSKKMLTFNNGSDVQSVTRKSTGTTQQWNVYPGYTDGDISYWFIDNAGNTSAHLNLRNRNLNSGTRVITYNNNHAHEEQWYLKYAKDGYYYIIARLSNKYLYCSSTTSGTALTVVDEPAQNATEETLEKYMWRFQPVDSKAETKAPEAPEITNIKRKPGCIELGWMAPVDDDPLTYTILRGEVSGEGEDMQITDWNTICRNDTLTSFIDNTALAGKTYAYKVVAVDYAGNRSKASDIMQASLLDEKALICQYQFDGDCTDNSFNNLNASLNADLGGYSSLASMKRSGTRSGTFGGTQYAMLPYSVGSQDEMTIATWVRWGTASDWQRIFDFGNDENQYMFLTPSSGREMRFVMKDKGEEQILSVGKKLGVGVWHHIAVTIKPIEDGMVNAVLYLDGEVAADSCNFTIKPSDIKPSLCYIGRSMFSSDPLFNGRLDDFRIYNYALTIDEVKAMMEDVEPVSKDIKDSYEEFSTAISSVSNVATGNGSSYDFSGRQIAAPKNGMFIENGKKIKK